MAGVWRGPWTGTKVLIPVLSRRYDWGPLEVEDFDEAWGLAESLSLESEYPGADCVIYQVEAGWEVSLIPQLEYSNGAAFRFHFGDMITERSEEW